MKLLVKPIYGWGWTNSLGESVEVPATFALEASVTPDSSQFSVAVGHLVECNDHVLNGLSIRLSQRHTIIDGHYNLVASKEESGLKVSKHGSAAMWTAGFAMAQQVRD